MKRVFANQLDEKAYLHDKIRLKLVSHHGIFLATCPTTLEKKSIASFRGHVTRCNLKKLTCMIKSG